VKFVSLPTNKTIYKINPFNDEEKIIGLNVIL